MSNVLPLHRSGDRGQGALVEDLATLDRTMNPLVAAQIAFDQLDVVECGEVAAMPRREVVQDLNRMAKSQQLGDEVGPDEAGPPVTRIRTRRA
jgi:hypothetical protein